MRHSEIDFHEEIITFLNKNGKMRRARLIDELMKAHTTGKKGQEFIDTGYSKPTINRRLREMLISGEIIALDYEQLRKYSFQEKDRRAKYLFTPEGLKLKTHIDEVLKLLETGDEIDKEMALKELNRYEKLYSFDESQLDLIVSNLTSVNADLTTKFLITLKVYITEKRKEPTDKEALLQSLKAVLDKYGEPTGKNKVIREVAIILLSHYKDEYVLDQLIKDANTLDNPLEVEYEYVNDPSMIADIVIQNPSRLFEAERHLMKEGKRDPAQFISNIRYRCMDSLGMIDHSKKEEAERRFREAEAKMDEGGI